MVRRIYVEKKEGFDIEAQCLYKELKSVLKIENLSGVRVLYRYDIEDISDELYEKSKTGVFSEVDLDDLYEEDEIKFPKGSSFGYEYLPGQFDQRSDSAVKCIKLLDSEAEPVVKYSRMLVIEGKVSAKEIKEIKEFLINPVDSKESETEKPETLKIAQRIPEDVERIDGFNDMP